MYEVRPLSLSTLSTQTDGVDFPIDTPRHFRCATAQPYTRVSLLVDLLALQSKEGEPPITRWKWEKVFFDEGALAAIAKCLSRDECQIKSLELSSCLCPASSLALLLEGAGASNKITQIDICDNLLADDCCNALGNYLMQNSILRTLKLSRLKMSPEGFGILIDGICSEKCALQKISLDRYYLTEAYRDSLNTLIQTSKLKVLNWATTPLNIPLHTIRYCLPQFNKDLQEFTDEIIFDGKFFDSNIMTHVTTHLHSNLSTITSLTISNCYWPEKLLGNLLKAVIMGQKINKMKIKNCCLSDEDCLELRLNLAQNYGIKTLEFINVKFSKDGFRDLVLGVCAKKQSLQDLKLESCRLNASHGDSLKKLIKKCALIKLNLENNQLGTNMITCSSSREKITQPAAKDNNGARGNNYQKRFGEALSRKLDTVTETETTTKSSNEDSFSLRNDCLISEKHANQRPILAIADALKHNITLKNLILSSNRLNRTDYHDLEKVARFNNLVNINVTHNGLEDFANKPGLKTSGVSPRSESSSPKKGSSNTRRKSIHVLVSKTSSFKK